MKIFLSAIVLWLLTHPIGWHSKANEGADERTFGASEEMIVPKLVAHSDGETAFTEGRQYIIDGADMWQFSLSFPAKSVEIYELKGGFKAGLHPAPANQILSILQGTLVIEASSGEVREFPPGSWVWVTDSKAPTKGHKSWAKDKTDIIAAVVRIDEEALPK